MTIGVKDGLRNYGFLLAGLILLGLGALVIASEADFKNEGRLVAHSYRVLGSLDKIQRLQEKASSELRGYLLAGQGSNLTALRSAESELTRTADHLIDLVADDPAKQLRANHLEKSVLQRLALAQKSIELFDMNDPAQLALVPQANLVQARSNEMIDTMRSVESKLLAKREERSNREFVIVASAAGLGIPLSLFMIGYTFFQLGHENKDRKRAVVQLEKLTADLEFLGKYGGMLQSAATNEELYAVTRQALRGLLPELAGRLFILRASRDRAEIAATWGNQAAASDQAPTPADCWAIRRNQPYMVEDSTRGVLCPHAQYLNSEAHATACIPLSGHGEVFGWLYLCQAKTGPIDGIELAINACEQLSMALANVTLRESLRQQAIRDLLTGLFNRRYLEESLEREVARCRRRSLSLSVLMIDVDHFKEFNDRYGHGGGDAVLSAFGKMLETMSRGEDIACRFGGEEFALVLPEASLEVATKRAEEIREATQSLMVTHLGRELPGIAVSIGVASVPDNGVSGPALLRAADEALYLAKRNGRNRTEIAAPLIAVIPGLHALAILPIRP